MSTHDEDVLDDGALFTSLPTATVGRRALLSLPIAAGAVGAATALGGCAAPRHLPCATPHGATTESAHAHCSMRHCRYFRA